MFLQSYKKLLIERQVIQQNYYFCRDIYFITPYLSLMFLLFIYLN